MGAWFMSVAAGLEFMFGKIEHAPRAEHDEDEEEGNEDADEFDSEEEKAARAREEAGADWMVEQGFDRKD
jgi:predicted deacetylase